MPYKGLTAEGIGTTNQGRTVIIKNWHPYHKKLQVTYAKRTLPISMIFMVSEPLGNTIVAYSLDDQGIVILNLELSPAEGDRLYVSMAEYLFQKECESRAYVFQGGVWQGFADYKCIPCDMADTWDKLDDAISGDFEV